MSETIAEFVKKIIGTLITDKSDNLGNYETREISTPGDRDIDVRLLHCSIA